MKKVEQLSSHLYLIDDFDLQHNERTGTYVLLGDDITLIETCLDPFSSVYFRWLTTITY